MENIIKLNKEKLAAKIRECKQAYINMKTPQKELNKHIKNMNTYLDQYHQDIVDKKITYSSLPKDILSSVVDLDSYINVIKATKNRR